MFWISISVSVVVSLGVCALYVHFWRRRIRRDMETDTIIGKLRSEVGEMVTELNGTTERNIALLEDRLNSLNELVDRAGKTAGVLHRESEKHDIASQVYTSLGRSRPVKSELNLDIVDGTAARGDGLNTAADSGAPPVVDSRGVDEDIVEFDSLPVREKVLVMHRNGESPSDIAGNTEMSVGEVELIISLHDRRHR